MSTDAPSTNTLERLVPEYVESGDATGQATLSLHVARYAFAAEHVRAGRLLDMACGVGYGTRILTDGSQANVTALGVDISEAAIDYAKENYGNEKTRYQVADATEFTDPEGFDTIVSLETIEHLPQPDEFVERLVRLLQPGGVVIGSVPTTPSVDANPYHCNDFTERSFRRMFERHGLREVACLRQVQPFNPFPLLSRKERRTKDLRTSLPRYYLAHPKSMAARLLSTIRFGFSNRYLVGVWSSDA